MLSHQDLTEHAGALAQQTARARQRLAEIERAREEQFRVVLQLEGAGVLLSRLLSDSLDREKQENREPPGGVEVLRKIPVENE